MTTPLVPNADLLTDRSMTPNGITRRIMLLPAEYRHLCFLLTILAREAETEAAPSLEMLIRSHMVPIGVVSRENFINAAVAGGDEVIRSHEKQTALIERTFLIRNREAGNVYIHRFRSGDTERVLHDHPWPSISIILSGRYLEHLPRVPPVIRSAGDVIVRAAGVPHRIDLIDDPDVSPTYTLFATGGKVRDWGFHCPNGWRPWQVYQGQGKGCDS